MILEVRKAKVWFGKNITVVNQDKLVEICQAQGQSQYLLSKFFYCNTKNDNDRPIAHDVISAL